MDEDDDFFDMRGRFGVTLPQKRKRTPKSDDDSSDSDESDESAAPSWPS